MAQPLASPARVLVAGASGGLGLPVVRALLARGHAVIGLARTARHRRLLERLGASAVVADALDAESIAAAVGAAAPEVVVDVLVSVPRGGPWLPEDMEAANQLRSQGTQNLLAAAVQAGVRRYVAESSYLVYGSGDVEDAPLTEEHAFQTGAPAKALREVVAVLATKETGVLDAFASGGIEGIVLRLGAVYGLGPDLSALVGELRRRHLPVDWRARGAVPWLHVDEAADAFVAAVERGRPGAVYNVAEDESTSYAAFLRCLAGTVGLAPPSRVPGWVFRFTAPYVEAALIRARIPLSTRRAKADLGWTPRFPGPREGLAAVAPALDEVGEASSTSPQAGESATTVLVALATNVVMLVAKAFGAVLTGSPALFAETLHSLADTGNEVFLYLALRRARRAADLRHPYGYGSELFFWSLLAALGIFLTGGVLSIWEGIQQLLHQVEATHFMVGYAVLGFGLVVDGTSWLRSHGQLRREARARGVGLRRHVRSTTDTTVTAVYLEDGAALLGGALAIAGLAAHQLLGTAVPDALSAIGVGVLLSGIGLRLAGRNRDLLTNLSESPHVLDRIRDVLAAVPEVTEVGRVNTLYVGPHQLLVAAEIQPDDGLSGLRLSELLAELSRRITVAVPRAVAVSLMPVLTADAPTITAFDPDYWLRRNPDPEQS